MRPRWRRVLAWALCIVIFGGAVAAGIRLSFPRDRKARSLLSARSHQATASVDAENKLLVIRALGRTRTYRLYETDDGVLAEEVEGEK